MADRKQFDLFGERVAPPVPAIAGLSRGAGDDLPDASERRRIVEDLESNLLVEAGAGAGKTTQMVERMVALVHAGRGVERIAAVTFTRKAAAELRERFQTELEQALRRLRATDDVGATERIDRALREIDRAFIGTIHSFCARLLRERPIEAGVDPNFREAFTFEQERLRRDFFAAHVERLAAAGDPVFADLARVGLRPDQLYSLFVTLTEHGDVEFPAESVARPDVDAARHSLNALIDEALELMPRDEPPAGWDNLQSAIRRMCFYRDVVGWDDDVRFLQMLAETLSVMPRATFNRWSDAPGVSQVVRALVRRFEDYTGPEGTGGGVLRQWWAHRYPIALSFAQCAAAEFEIERVRTGALSFQDLLMRTAALLGSSASARDDLGDRYRYVLVDEFQDTDPVQAEVLFLLSSPASESDGSAAEWHYCVPRPGALFVVGDPKQSIYRFRRADITTYNQVKRRFEEFGGVVRLTANFRSGASIERLVDTVFRDRFPADATAHQASFAPLQVRPAAKDDGVFHYDVRKPGRRPRDEELNAIDAARVASWIEERIRSENRGPGDFLVLTRRKKFLTAYAREIEARNLPVQVTGGGVGIEEELSELRLLLEALADPGDATLTVAVLIGLFFGLDYEQIAHHIIDVGGTLDITLERDMPATEIERALARLHDFWNTARREPADVVVSRLIHELGLLPYAAAGELGESRAGAVLYVLEAVRSAAQRGDASIRGAITAIDAALDAEEAEAPLEPGRTDVIRAMNLHQAKGLEANVVILAAPFGRFEPAPLLHVTRHESGAAIGRIVVAGRQWRKNDTVLARPLDWPQHESIERTFREAENDRLLYVAATRAREQLIIAHYEDDSDSPWGAFHPYLDVGFPYIELTAHDPPPRATLDASAAGIIERAQAVASHRRMLSSPSWQAAAVRTRVRPAGDRDGDDDDGSRAREPMDADDDGLAWGRLVHGALEAAGRGLEDDALRSFCKAGLLAEEGRPRDANDEPTELEPLLDVVRAVVATPLWQRARASRMLLVEAPFSIAIAQSDYGAIGALGNSPFDAPIQVVDGVIDLLFREENGWCIVDYKSDRAGADIDAEARAKYLAQVELYGECWSRLTGEPVSERIILFTRDGTTLSW